MTRRRTFRRYDKIRRSKKLKKSRNIKKTIRRNLRKSNRKVSKRQYNSKRNKISKKIRNKKKRVMKGGVFKEIDGKWIDIGDVPEFNLKITDSIVRTDESLENIRNRMYLAFDQMDTIPDGCGPDPRNEALLIWKSAYEDMKKLLRPGSRESPHHKQSYKMVIGGALEYFVKRLKSKEMIEEADDLLKWVEMEEAAEDEEEAEKDAPLLVEARKSAESLSEIFHKPLEGTDEDFLARWPACNMYQRVLRAGDDVQPDQLETFKADLEELYNTMIQEHIDSLQQLAETQGEGKDKEEIISILKKHYHPFFTYPTDNDILKATGFIVPPKRPSSPIHNYFLRHKRSKIKS